MKGRVRQPRRCAVGVLGAVALQAMMTGGAFAQDRQPLKIGQLSDMSGIVRDLSGPGTNVAMKLAIEDFGGSVLGRPIAARRRPSRQARCRARPCPQMV